MISSKEIEALVQKVEERALRIFGKTPSIYVSEEDGCWKVDIEYGPNDTEEACCGMFDDELDEFLRCDLYDHIHDHYISKEYQEKRDLKLMMMGANRFQFHAWNFESVYYEWEDYSGNKHAEHLPRFIVEVNWTCGFNHIVDKWKYATSNENPCTYIPRLYAELSSDNRTALLEWIMKNYTDEQKLSF